MDFLSIMAWVLMAALVVFRVAFFVGLVWLIVMVYKGVREEILRGRLVKVEATGGAVQAARKAGSLD